MLVTQDPSQVTSLLVSLVLSLDLPQLAACAATEACVLSLAASAWLYEPRRRVALACESAAWPRELAQPEPLRALLEPFPAADQADPSHAEQEGRRT